MRQPTTRSRSRRISATLALTLALTGTVALAGAPQQLQNALPLIAAVAGPASADAGTWAQVTCTQPLAGLPQAPTEGWVARDGGGTATQGCDPYTGGLIASIPDTTAFGDGAGASWLYTAPGGSTIAGGQIVAQLYAPQGLAYISTGAASAAMASCQGGSPCGGTVGGSTGAVTLPIAPVGGTTISEVVQCTAPSSGTLGSGGCPAGQGGSGLDAQINLYQAIVDLTNNSTPAATNFAGALLTPGPVTGTQPITFTATDPSGPGVINISVAIDGVPVPGAQQDTNSGHCTPIGRDAGGYPEFLYAQPCKQSIGFSQDVPTAGLTDGNHSLSVTVTDAAGNSSVVLKAALNVANYTTVSANLNATHAPPPAPPAPPAGATPPPAPVYAITLDPATQPLTKGVHRTFASSAVNISGTLRNSAGVPAPGVPVTLLAQNGSIGNPVALGTTTSDATGHWTLDAPRGPSRILTITYGTQAQAATAGAGVAINETVTPALTLSIRPLGRGRLRFSGQLKISPLGTPRPQVVIEARNANLWQTVGEPLALTPGGHYKSTYNAGPLAIGGHYVFRAVSAPSSLYTAATSSTRRTVVR